MEWQARQFRFNFPRPTLVMGVINVTPDSFSDGGRFLEPEAAIEAALAMETEGADLIDIGGESTRPGAGEVVEREELGRVLPVFEGLAGRIGVPLSVDTRKPRVARAALEAGAAIVNDVGAAESGPEMWEVLAEYQAGYVVMHMQGGPRAMQDHPVYHDVVEEVHRFFGERIETLRASGIEADRVVLDVGIGFGKRLEHNLQLLSSLSRFKTWHRPLLLGASRKSFIGQVTGVSDPRDRLPGSLACACLAVASGVEILRVHDVAATKQAVRVSEAVRTQAQSDG